MKINTNKTRLAYIASLDLGEFISDIEVIDLWTTYETGIRLSVKTNGPRYTLDRYKLCYMFLRNIILQLPTSPIPFCITDKRGIPKPLWPLRPLIKGEVKFQRLALSIARSYELIKLPIDYSTETIEQDPLGVNLEETSKLFKEFLTKFTCMYP